MSKIKALVILGLIFALMVTMVIIPGCKIAAVETTAAGATTVETTAAGATTVGTIAAGATTEKPQEKKFEGTTITIMTFLNPAGETAREKVLKEIIDDFKNKTGITVKILLLPWADIEAQLILSVQAGDPPDVAWVRNFSFDKHMEAGSLMSLDSYVANDFDEATIKDFLIWDQSGMSNGKKYAIPFSFQGQALFVRKDLLDKVGVKAPRTWQEFIKVGEALKSLPGITPFLFAASPAQPTQLQNVQSVIEGRGGKILDDAGMAVFDSQAGIETYEFLKSLVYDYGIVPKTAITAKSEDVNDAFVSGKVAMIFSATPTYPRSVASLGAEKVELVRIPGLEVDKPFHAFLGCWMLGIPKGSKNPDAAWEFIKYFNSVEVQLKYAKMSGEVPSRQSVSKDAYFKSPEGAVANWWQEYFAYGSFMAVAPTTYNELEENLSLAMQGILASPDSNVKNILESAAKKYNDIVGKK